MVASSASVLLTSTIVVPSAGQADSVNQQLAGYDELTLGVALSITLVSIEAPTVAQTVAPPLSSAQALGNAVSVSHGHSDEVVFALAAVIAVLVLVLVLVAFRRQLKKKRRFQMTQTTVVKATESGISSTTTTSSSGSTGPVSSPLNNLNMFQSVMELPDLSHSAADEPLPTLAPIVHGGVADGVSFSSCDRPPVQPTPPTSTGTGTGTGTGRHVRNAARSGRGTRNTAALDRARGALQPTAEHEVDKTEYT